jgi:predicted RNase H-like HicB family nuclease
MKLPVVIEPLDGKGFRARCGEPVILAAEGATPFEAIDNLRDLLTKHVAAGAQIAEIDVPTVTDNPWLAGAGMLPADDPLVEEWLQIIEENRHKTDEEPNLP